MKKLAAALVLMSLSAFPAFAANVKVSAFSTYLSKYNNFEAKIVTPVVSGLTDAAAQKQLNDKLASKALKLIAEYNGDVSGILADDPNTEAHMGCDSNFEVKTNTAKILAFDVYVLNTAGSSNTTRSFYVIDKVQGRLLTLKGLFRHNADYVTVLSKYIKTEMERRNAKENGMFWVKNSDPERFKAIKPDQNFYLDEKGNIVICFDKYEVAAGAGGTPEFIIPAKVADPLLAK